MRVHSWRHSRLGSRLLMVLVIGSGALTVSGCPVSNWSGPSIASAAAATSAPPPIISAPVTPPPDDTPPPSDPPPAIPPPSDPPPSVPPPTSPAPSVPLPIPTAVNGTLHTTAGATGTGTLAGTGSGALVYAIIVPTLSGTANLTDPSTGAFTYTPNAGFSGTDRFQFTVTDSVGTSHPATVTITILPAAPGAHQVVGNIGASTDWVCYWCTGQPFVDMVKQSSSFGDPVTGIPLIEEGKLDTDGWPTANFKWMVLCCVKADGSVDDPGPASPLAGKYQLSFNGKAVLQPLTFQVQDQLYDPVTNTTTAALDLGMAYQGGNAMLTFSNTQRDANAAIGTGVTNIKIIRPQFAPNGTKWWDSPTQQFTKPYLDSIRGLSTIRYINWTKVIGSPEVNWSDRTPANWPIPSHLMQAPASSLPYLTTKVGCTQYCDWYATGASWDSAIDLANASHTDMWINIPVMATDAYVTSLATLIKATLDPALHVYVEWSDEIWNTANPYWTETNYNNDQANALIASDPTVAANYANNCASWTIGQCHMAERVKQFGDLFASVYGRSAINTTIRPVFCTQAVQPALFMEALRYIAKTYGPPSDYFYGICNAPYWSPKPKLAAGATVAEVVAAMQAAIPNTGSYIEANTTIALYYGLHNLTYEGGPALEGSGASASVLAVANLDPGMQTNVRDGLTDFFRRGGDMYMYYSLAGSGSYWGAMPDPLDLHAPKLLGLRDVIGQPVVRSAGTALPGVVAANPPKFALLAGTPVPTWHLRNCSALDSDGKGTCDFSSAISVGNGYGYLVTAPADATYSVSLVLSSTLATVTSSLQLVVDGHSAGTFTVSDALAGAAPATTTLTVTLAAGAHVIELLNASATGSCSVSGINFVAQ